MQENRAHATIGRRRALHLSGDRKTVSSNGDHRTVNRLLIVAGMGLICMTAVFGRLGYLQLYCHREYLTRAQRQQQRVIEITPKRGAIYDRNMHPLAMSIPVD